MLDFVLVGCDPGLSGAICVYDTGTKKAVIVDVVTRRIRGVKTATVKNEIDSLAVISALKDAIDGRPVAAALIERVGSRAGQGMATGASLAHSMGSLEACICAATGLSVMAVRPQEWKAFHGLIGEQKTDSRDVAAKLLPDCAHLLKRKKDHDRAEAMLIALYANNFANQESDVIQ